MTRKLALAAMLTSVLALSACNTAHGVKEDVNSAGRAVEKATDGKK